MFERGEIQVAGTEKIKGRRQTQYICSTPYDKCYGKNPKSKEKFRMHSTPEQVKACLRNYLLSQGYERLGPREFKNPETGSILLLSKKPTRAKPGKTEYMIPNHNGKILSR